MKIKFKPLFTNVKLPQQSNEGDSGWDVCSIDDGIVSEDGYIEYRLGFSLEIPQGYGIQIRPRSSISNYDLILCNSVGTWDASYRGEGKIRFKIVPRLCQTSDKNCQVTYLKPLTQFVPNTYKKGNKIAQLIVEKLVECEFVIEDTLSTTERGSGGFGSSGQ